MDETVNIVRNVVESGDAKIVIFSQWERMTRLIAAELDKMGVGYASLNGSVPSEKRKNLIDDFCDNPDCRVFVSTDTGSTGLNLQAASLVINLDLPWNPAVLEQRICRIYRIGQNRNIQVINMVSKDSFEERMLGTLDFKSSLFEGVLDGGDDTVIIDDSRMNHIMDAVAGYVEEETRKPVAEGIDNGDDIGLVEDLTDAEEEDRCVESEELIRQGVTFLHGLAETLKSPEASARLVNTLVHTDPETGKQELRIPIPGKDAAGSILTLIARLMSK